MASNAGDAVADRDAGQVGTGKERIIPDAADRQAIERAGDGHSTAETGVLGDGDRAVVGRECELGLHQGGERQQQ